jgi:hypothetical protein
MFILLSQGIDRPLAEEQGCLLVGWCLAGIAHYTSDGWQLLHHQVLHTVPSSTLLMPLGRYTRDPNQQRNMQDEIQAVKAREEQLMMEVRGCRMFADACCRTV